VVFFLDLEFLAVSQSPIIPPNFSPYPIFNGIQLITRKCPRAIALGLSENPLG